MASYKPPYVRLTDSILDMILNDRYFPLSACCTRKMHDMQNKGSNCKSTSMIGNIVVQNEDTATNIDQDHKKYGTWADFVDGWLHYILLLLQLGYSSEIVQDRIITLRWLTDADYQPQSKLKYWYEIRRKFPQQHHMWMVLQNDNSMLGVQFLKPFIEEVPRHGRHQPGPPNPRPDKRQKHGGGPNPNGKPTLKNKAATQAQSKALRALNQGLTKPLRLCHSSNNPKKTCMLNPCPYAHVCIKCAGQHSRADCPLP
jgi:hypothetical protein